MSFYISTIIIFLLYSLFETNLISSVLRKRNDFRSSRVQITNFIYFHQIFF